MAGIYGNSKEDRYFENMLFEYLDEDEYSDWLEEIAYDEDSEEEQDDG